MREITLFPGESITIGDTIIKAVQRGGQFIATPFPIPEAPVRPQELPSAPAQPGQPWKIGDEPHRWPYDVICSVCA